MDDEEILTRAARAVAAEARSEPGHPPPDALLAYHEETLDAKAREEVQEHLAACPDCARVIVDLAAFPEVELVRDDQRLDEGEVERAWERLARATGRVCPCPPAGMRRCASSARWNGRLAWCAVATVGTTRTCGLWSDRRSPEAGARLRQENRHRGGPTDLVEQPNAVHLRGCHAAASDNRRG